MTSTMGVSPSGTQASAAVYNLDAVAKQPQTKRDDVVAPIDTAGGESAKSDLSLFKMARPSVGHAVDVTV